MAVQLRARLSADGEHLLCGRCGRVLAQLRPIPDWDGEADTFGLVAQLPAGYVRSDESGRREWHATRMRKGKPAFRRHLPLPDEEGLCLDSSEALVVCWKCQRPNIMSWEDGHYSAYRRVPRRDAPVIVTTVEGRTSVYRPAEPPQNLQR
jgi:hypothetical protein